MRSVRALLVGVSCISVLGVSPPATAGVVWRPCVERSLKGLQCATLTVPKDYANPSAGTFAIAMVRSKATGRSDQRRGTLFFNPGGPGVSGVSTAPDVVSALPSDLRRRFDFVTWDPRGVGRSSGLNDCAGGSYTLPATGPVDWAHVSEQMRSSQRQANRDCAEKHPDVVPYIGTVNTVRDLEEMRKAVGDRKLTYWGTSYGTRIGAVYAHLYPARVRAMLLSSPVAPNADWTSFVLGAGVAPDNAVGFFFEVTPNARARFQRVTKTLAVRPLSLPSGAVVTRWDVQAVVSTSVTSQSGYPEAAGLLRTLDSALHSSGRVQRRALAALDGMQWPDSYPVNGGATAFIGCLDLPQRFTAEEQVSLAQTLRADAPIFGFGTSQALYYCEGVDVPADPVPSHYVNRQTPMLIVGSTRDALTSFQWATDVARTFRNSRVMAYVGTVHTPVFTSGSSCLDRAATKYLITRKRPRHDKACPTTLG